MFTRALVVLLMMAGGTGTAVYRYWTDPVTVRRMVLEGLRQQFPGAEVSLDSARLWPGWGIHITNLTLARKDDSSLSPVLQVPSGRIEHDAAALAEGKMRIQRIKMDRPRLTALRSADGRWNLDGLLAPPKPGIILPIIVVERGTMVLRLTPPSGGESVWEIGNIRASLLEEIRHPAKFEARGDSSRLGRLQIEGTWDRQPGHVNAALDLTGLPVSLNLLHELARFAPLPIEHVRHVNGVGRIHLDAKRRSDDGLGWQTDWRVGISQGSIGLRLLPMDLTAIEGTARIYQGRLIVPEIHAQAADASVHGKLEAKLPAADPASAVLSAAIAVDRLLITPELFARLPESARRFQQRFAPVGRMSFVFQFARRTANGWDARLDARPEDLAARYHKFPYPLRKIRGSVVTEYASDQPDRHVVDVTAEVNGGSRFALRGTVAGEDPHPDIDLFITAPDGQTAARDVPVDDDLILSFPPRFQPIARSFHFHGKCDIFGRIHRVAGQAHGHDQYHVQCRNAAVCYDLFPVPIEQFNAELELHLGPGVPGDPNRGDYWVLRSASGVHRGGQVGVTARAIDNEHGQQIVIETSGVKLPIDDSLARAMAVYKLKPTWELLAPSGTLDYSARVVLTDMPDGSKRPEVTLAVQGASCRPGFFPYALTEVSAHLYAEPNRVILGECSARHGPTRMRISGGELRTDQGLWADVRNIRAAPLLPDNDFLAALPVALQKAGHALQLSGVMDVNVARLVFHDPPVVPGPPGPPILYWDGMMGVNQFGLTTGVGWNNVGGIIACRGAVKGNRLDWLTGHLALESATILRQPLQQLHAQLQVEPDAPDVLQVRHVRGRMFSGDLAGEARINFGGGLDYALDLKALGVKLEEFGQHNQIGAGKLEGRTSAQLYLTGRGTGIDELSGRGDIDVPSGQLYDLPLVLELFKAISLRVPDGVAFDEAHAQFKIDGRRLTVERLDLLGNAVSLGGAGTLNLDGTDLNLDFYAVWARIVQVLPVGWRDLPPWISKQFLKIKMRGSLEQPKFAPEPVPFIIEPVQSLITRMQQREAAAK
jgi:hypothetical protein